jgi:hypothetical protein
MFRRVGPGDHKTSNIIYFYSSNGPPLNEGISIIQTSVCLILWLKKNRVGFGPLSCEPRYKEGVIPKYTLTIKWVSVKCKRYLEFKCCIFGLDYKLGFYRQQIGF